MTLRSWAEPTGVFLLAALALYAAVFPALSVVYALVTGAPLFAQPPQYAAAVVAVGGTYPFVAGDWSLRRLGIFAVALWVASGAVGLVGLVAIARTDLSPPSALLARAVALAVAYPFAAMAAFRNRVRTQLGFRPV